jgi:MFS transporter, DHA2 family, multidrug resistance protein
MSTGVERTRWGPVAALGLAMLVVTSEMTIAAVTLPGLGRDLGVGPAATAWVLLAYALPMAAIAIPVGRWVDGADVRATFLVSMVGVGLASVLGALAPAFWILLAARVLQGMSAGLVVAVYMPIVLGSVREEQRGRAFGAIVTIMTLGGMAGVPLGGLVAGAFSWREVFVMKIPLLFVVAWLAFRTVRSGPGRGLPLPRLTLLHEAVLLGGTVTAVLLAFDQVDDRPVLAGGLALTALALGTWWTRLPSARPVLTLVRGRTFAAALIALLCMSLTMGLIVFLLPYLIADVLAGSPELTGIALLFFVGVMAPISPVAGMLSDRYGTMLIARVGSAVMVAGMITMVTVGAAAGLVDLAWRLAVLGAGAALFNTPINAAILAATPAGMAGTSGGLAMTARTVATTVGPAVAALCWTLAGGGIAGFRTGVVVLTLIACGGFVALCAVPRRVTGPVAEDLQTADADSSPVA